MEQMTTWQAVCKSPCRWISAPLATREDAENEGDGHVIAMARIGDPRQHEFYVQDSS